tara:strand:- start:747 stop:1115 length:369 start_codon:yes stop_codon:yes gene_type:complete
METRIAKIFQTYAEGMANLKKQESELWQKLAFQAENLSHEEHETFPEVKVDRSKLKSFEDLPPVLTADDVAKLLGIAKETLNVWRVRGDGPEYIKVGRLVRYKRDAILDYVEGCVKKHTSQY